MDTDALARAGAKSLLAIKRAAAKWLITRLSLVEWALAAQVAVADKEAAARVAAVKAI